MPRKQLIAIAVALVAVGAGTSYLLNNEEPSAEQEMAAMDMGTALVNIRVPASLSERAQIGEKAFNARCVACHGQNGAGTEGMGPPLIHITYEPSHHGDESFQRAVAFGVQSHHWRFGNMPAQPGLSRADVGYIIAYIRELQRANGIN